jgi:hypothetical protein
MSLIQEALKRKDDENLGIPPKAIPLIPPVAHETAVRQSEIPAKQSVPPVKEKTSPAWPVLVISLLVITTLALGAIGILLWSITRSGQQKVVNAAIESPASPAVVSEPIVASAPEPVRVAPAAVPKPVEPVTEAAPATAAVPQAPASVAPMVFSISTGIVKEGTTEKKPAPAEVSVVPVSRPVSLQSSWPTLKVVGVMAPRSTAQSGAAIIDGNLVECGDEIRGVKVQGVDKSGVWFEFKSQTQFVRVGQTTL